MKPFKYPEADRCLTKPNGMTDDECESLWVATAQDNSTLSCWKMTWRERLSALFFGKTWVWVLAGGITQPPIAITVHRDVIDKKTRRKIRERK